MKKTTIVLAAGGTGGHIYPAISIADALKEINPNLDLHFVGTKSKLEWVAVPNAGYPIHHIWISGFHRRFTLKNLIFPFKLLTSLFQSISILKRLNPVAVIGCGGYVSGPAGYIAERMNIPVFLQEQNSFPGVTNRLLAKKAILIFTAFEQAHQWFPIGKTRLLGNPTRKNILEVNRDHAFETFHFTPKKKTILILGGSGGAKSINEAMIQRLDELHNELEIQIIWQCGARYYDDIVRRIDVNKYQNLRFSAFINTMAEAYEVADLVVSRAGAGSCAEFLATAKPSILVPSPFVAGDHQTENAKAMVENGASLMLKDHQLSSDLVPVVSSLIQQPDRLLEMSRKAKDLSKSDAAHEIAQTILHEIQSHN